MEPPENCPKRLFELMHLCWKKKPQHRPSFLELVTRLLPESGEMFHEVSFYHQPDHKDLRDMAMATVLAKSKARAIAPRPMEHDIENFHIDSESDEDLGEAAALTSSRGGGGSPLRLQPVISRSPLESTTTNLANNNGPKVVNGGSGGGGQANGFLSGYNHRNHHNHNHGLNHSASSSSEPHKTTEC